MRRPRISEAEWEVMEVVWKRPSLTAGEIVAELASRTEWAPTTIRTMLARLAAKKVVSMQKEAGGVSFRARISREECVLQESESFAERVFGGVTNPLLLHFVQRAKLSPEEVKELQRILRAKGKA
jgi:BlaI family penicillinase repressor